MYALGIEAPAAAAAAVLSQRRSRAGVCACPGTAPATAGGLRRTSAAGAGGEPAVAAGLRRPGAAAAWTLPPFARVAGCGCRGEVRPEQTGRGDNADAAAAAAAAREPLQGPTGVPMGRPRGERHVASAA